MTKCIEILMWGKGLSYKHVLLVQKYAKMMDIKGTAFFKGDGSLKIIADGEERNLDTFIGKLNKKRLILLSMFPIENFSVIWKESKNEFESFIVSETME